MRKGFTLIELSVVLVIIGLLISGLLVGRSMIRATEMQGIIRQVQRFDIAVENFREMYGSYPGDANIYESDGDNDGIIEDDDNLIIELNDEMGAFWNNLGTNGLGEFYTADSFTLEVGYPKAQMGSGLGGFLAYGVGEINYYQTGVFAETGTDVITVGANLSAGAAYAVDSKIDDTVANTGIVQAREGDGAVGLNVAASAGAAGGATCTVTGGAGYNISYNASEECTLRFEMLSQTTE